MTAIALLDEAPVRRHKPNDPARFKAERAAQADLEQRIVRCLHCPNTSGLVDGPAGRAWFKTHDCARRKR